MLDIIKRIFCKHEWTYKLTQEDIRPFGHIVGKEMLYQCPKCLKIKKIKY